MLAHVLGAATLDRLEPLAVVVRVDVVTHARLHAVDAGELVGGAPEDVVWGWNVCVSQERRRCGDECGEWWSYGVVAAEIEAQSTIV